MVKQKNKTQRIKRANAEEESDRMKLSYENVSNVLKTVSFLLIIYAFVQFSSNPISNNSIYLWLLVGLFGLISLLDLFVNTASYKRNPFLIYIFSSGGVFAIEFLINTFYPIAILSDIPNGAYIIYIMVALVIGKLLTDLFILEKIKVSEDQSGGLKYAILANRYQLSFLLATIGTLMFIGGFFTPYEWYYAYLIPALSIIPLAIFIIRDITAKLPQSEEKQSFLKRTNMLSYLIVFAVTIVIFLIMVFLIWDMLSITTQEIGFNNWILFSIVASIGLGVILQIIFNKGFFEALKVTGQRIKDRFSKRSTDGIDTWDLKEQLLLLEFILIAVFSLSGFYLCEGILNILNETGVFYINIIQIILGSIFALGTMMTSQYYYAEYLHRVKKMDILEVRKTIFLLGLLYYVALAIMLSVYALDNTFDVSATINYSMLIIFVVIMIQILMLPKPTISSGADAISKKVIYIIALILGLASLGAGIYGMYMYSSLTFTYIILSILALVFGTILTIYSLILFNRSPIESVKDEERSRKTGFILIIIGAIALAYTILIVGLIDAWDFTKISTYPDDLTTMTTNDWLNITALIGLIIALVSFLIGAVYVVNNSGKVQAKDGFSKKSSIILLAGIAIILTSLIIIHYIFAWNMVAYFETMIDITDPNIYYAIISAILFLVGVVLIIYSIIDSQKNKTSKDMEEGNKKFIMLIVLFLICLVVCIISLWHFDWIIPTGVEADIWLLALIFSIVFGVSLLALIILALIGKKIEQKADGISGASKLGLFLLISGLTLGLIIYFGVWVMVIPNLLDLTFDTYEYLFYASIIIACIGLGISLIPLIKSEKQSTDAIDDNKLLMIFVIIVMACLLGIGLYFLIAYPFDITSIQSILGLVSVVMSGILVIFSIFYFKREGISIPKIKEPKVKEPKVKETKAKVKTDSIQFQTDGTSVIELDVETKPSELKIVRKGVIKKKHKGANEFIFDV